MAFGTKYCGGIIMASLPYVTAPGNIERALIGIKKAETPSRVTQDFVKTILKIHGGSGNQIASFLKKLGFVNSDGTPSDLYKKFRNDTTSGIAILEALKTGYAPLYRRNEYMHKLGDDDLRGLIIEETGQGKDSNVPGLIVAAISAIKKFITEDKSRKDNVILNDKEADTTIIEQEIPIPIRRHSMNLSYTINLNLPPTSDISVFNAIFKALKDNLLKDIDE
jgi:hypothetical protein